MWNGLSFAMHLQDIRNTIGNVPLEWYKEFDHIGYDLFGKKIGKPKAGDEIDKFLDKMDNPDYWYVEKNIIYSLRFI
jgi:ribosome biogenesis protein ERB1